MKPSKALRATILALAVAGLAPTGAWAGESTQDPAGGSTPAGYGSAPDQPHGSTSSADSCKWTVKGHLYVQAPTLDGISDGDPLVGVAVKVSGASSVGSTFGAFNEWRTAYTDANGEFSVTHTECDQRRVRVEAKFLSSSGDLRVLGPSSPEWYVLKDTGDVRDAGTIDLGGEPFGGETGDQATKQARIDAQTWILYRRAMDYVTSLGYPFLNDVTVHNPASIHLYGNSWTDPVFHGIHIDPDLTTARWNLLHELGHAWAYPRETHETCLVLGAAGPDTTHSAHEKRCVAYNEGFANFFASKLDEELVAAGKLKPTTEPPGPTTPFSRAFLVSNGILSLDDASHVDLGFDQAFRVLTQPDVTRELFGDGLGSVKGANAYVQDYTGPSCAGYGVPTGGSGLSTALKVIGDADDQFDIADDDQPTIEQVLDRAADRLPKLDPLDAALYETIVDPASDEEPHEVFKC
jgi:hypothetical protein